MIEDIALALIALIAVGAAGAVILGVIALIRVPPEYPHSN